MLINIDNNYIFFFSPKSRTTGKVTKDCRDAKEPSIKTNVGPGKLFAVRTAPNQHRIKEVIIRQKNIIIKHRKKLSPWVFQEQVFSCAQLMVGGHNRIRSVPDHF